MHTMKTHELEKMMAALPLSALDAVRLVLEAVEELDEQAQGANRLSLMRTLRGAMRKGVEALREERRTVSFATAAWESVEARGDKRPTTRRDLRHFVRRMLRLDGVAERPLRLMRTEECRTILQRAFGNSIHSFRKGRAILHSIFVHGRAQGWCTENPVSCIKPPVAKEQMITPLSLEEIRRLEQTAHRPEHRKMLFSLALMLYAGVRPGEICRLQPARDILWAERLIIIRPIASKTGGGRTIPLRKSFDLKESACIIPKNWATRWRNLRRAAGFTTWQPDVLRHTFASYHAAYYRNIPELQLEMGHRNAHLLHTRYVIPTSRRDAEAFFNSHTP